MHKTSGHYELYYSSKVGNRGVVTVEFEALKINNGYVLLKILEAIMLCNKAIIGQNEKGNYWTNAQRK